MGKNPFYVNGEGYTDSTAGKALQNVNQERHREERKKYMAKKRSYRRTEDESRIHEKAVKMRKMTDEQLVHYVEDRVEKARSEGFNQGKQKEVPARTIDIESIMDEIWTIRGIGPVKFHYIRSILERRLGASNG